MVRDVAAAPGLVYLDAARAERVGCRENVRTAAVAPHAKRQHVRMLEQQQQVVDAPRTTVLDERPLQREGVGVWHASEPPDFDGSHSSTVTCTCRAAAAAAGSQFSSVCFRCDMNSSATAPSIKRWSYPSVRYPIGLIAIASSITTGRFSMLPTPRMATCGWLMIGMPNSAPKTPGFVIVNVPAGDFVGLELLCARARRQIRDGAAQPQQILLVRVLDDRARSVPSRARRRRRG